MCWAATYLYDATLGVELAVARLDLVRWWVTSFNQVLLNRKEPTTCRSNPNKVSDLRATELRSTLDSKNFGPYLVLSRHEIEQRLNRHLLKDSKATRIEDLR